jgi:predicted RNA-binding protein YlqC (UPF0109 family)
MINLLEEYRRVCQEKGQLANKVDEQDRLIQRQGQHLSALRSAVEASIASFKMISSEEKLLEKLQAALIGIELNHDLESDG